MCITRYNIWEIGAIDSTRFKHQIPPEFKKMKVSQILIIYRKYLPKTIVLNLTCSLFQVPECVCNMYVYVNRWRDRGEFRRERYTQRERERFVFKDECIMITELKRDTNNVLKLEYLTASFASFRGIFGTLVWIYQI